MNKTTLLLCAGLIFALAGGSQAYSQAATEYGLASAYSHGIANHSAASGRIYHRNAMTLAHKSLPSGSKMKKSNGRTADARVAHRGPTQQGRLPEVSPPVQHSTEIQMTIVGAARQ